MPYLAYHQDVHSLFRTRGYNVDRIVISIDPFTGCKPSDCFVELKDEVQADHPVQRLNGTSFLRHLLKVKPCRPRTKFSSNRPFGQWDRDDTADHWTGLAAAELRLYVGVCPIAELFQDFKRSVILPFAMGIQQANS
jgi:hypothetical protein